MSRLIFVNLPVKNVALATRFYEAIGGRRNDMFSDATASCIVLSETIHIMLLDHEKFQQFTGKKIANAHEVSEVIICISAADKQEVDSIISKAITAGGNHNPLLDQDYGFMYGRSFEDLDGHIWEVMWMDMEAAQKSMG